MGVPQSAERVPPAAAVLVGRVRIARLVAVLVVAAMDGAPHHGAFHRQRPRPSGQAGPAVGVERAVREQPVKADGDAQARDHIAHRQQRARSTQSTSLLAQSRTAASTKAARGITIAAKLVTWRAVLVDAAQSDGRAEATINRKVGHRHEAALVPPSDRAAPCAEYSNAAWSQATLGNRRPPGSLSFL